MKNFSNAIFKAFLIFSFLSIIFCGRVLSKGFELIGAGATFPYPLYYKMFHEYYKAFGVRVNYQAIGSGGGIRQLINKTVDFGATDAFMTDEEMKMAGTKIVHVPICVGAVVITYNLPNNPEIKLTPDIISDIFLGKIRVWSDPRIKEINPEIELPDLPIVVVHRSDGSGTTFVFSDYLSKVSKDWGDKVGRGKSLSWPCGLGGKGNPGVAGLIRQIPGAIGYVELAYAASNRMPTAIVRNRSKKFVKPTVSSVSLSACVKIPPDARVSLTDTRAKFGYPISSFTWIIVYKEQKYGKRKKGVAFKLVRLLWWMTHEGQKYTIPLGYAPLPKNAVKVAERILESISYGGKRILNLRGN